MMETGAHAIGCTVFAGGTGQTEQQVSAMAELKPAGYIGTPSFLKIIVEKAAEMGVALPYRMAANSSWTRFMHGPITAPPFIKSMYRKLGVLVAP